MKSYKKYRKYRYYIRVGSDYRIRRSVVTTCSSNNVSFLCGKSIFDSLVKTKKEAESSFFFFSHTGVNKGRFQTSSSSILGFGMFIYLFFSNTSIPWIHTPQETRSVPLTRHPVLVLDYFWTRCWISRNPLFKQQPRQSSLDWSR